MRRYFVTGASGYIGSKLVEILLERGDFVRGLSRRTRPEIPPGYEKSANLLWNHPHFEYLPGDVTDIEAIRNGMRGCDHVFHMAAYAKNWARDVSIYERVNIEGMRNVFQVALEQKVKRIVWTSSIVTFGPSRPGEIRNESTFPRATESFATDYERTKTLAEIEALSWAAEKNLPLVIVNPTRVYGPGQFSEGNAMAELIADYTSGKAPFLPNRGVNIGNYAFVDDVAFGHLLAMEHGRIAERYILGGENVTLRELYEHVDFVSGKKHLKIPLLKFGPFVFSYMQYYRARIFGVYPRITPGWIRTFVDDWAFSCEKAKTELGYAPRPLREGLDITWKWLSRMKNNARQTLTFRIHKPHGNQDCNHVPEQ